MPAAPLPSLPYDEWHQTKDTLHLWAQIVGKVKLATTAPQNHWWNVPLYVDVRGLTTRRLQAGGISFELSFDFLEHRLELRTDQGHTASFALEDGLSVAGFDSALHAMLADGGVDVPIREQPFGVPMNTPFTDDREHASYRPELVVRYWRILEWADSVFNEFAGWSCAKTSPVHLFWHSFDLAVTRFSGRRAPPNEGADGVTQEAYSGELISFGFWPGDENLRAPTFYSYTAPEPAGLRAQPLSPATARWVDQGAGSLATVDYDDVRGSVDPRATLLAFLQSTYLAGTNAAGWDEEALRSSFCPAPAPPVTEPFSAR